nr:hypothetical protein [Pantoea sp. 1.19]
MVAAVHYRAGKAGDRLQVFRDITDKRHARLRQQFADLPEAEAVIAGGHAAGERRFPDLMIHHREATPGRGNSCSLRYFPLALSDQATLGAASSVCRSTALS